MARESPSEGSTHATNPPISEPTALRPRPVRSGEANGPDDPHEDRDVDGAAQPAVRSTGRERLVVAARAVATRAVALAAALLLGVGGGADAALPACTITGTEGPDLLVDTPGNDVLCGLGGNDTIGAGPGNDVLLGGPGNDLLEGAAGNDMMYGGAGNDRINAWDGRRDVVHGGTGVDRAYVDKTLDRVRFVERS